MSFIFKDFWIRILCVIIAGGLWVYAISGDNKTDYFPGKIPIVPKNVSKNLAPVYDQDEMQVKVMAGNKSWDELSTESFNAYVDLENLSIGTHEVDVEVTSSVPGVKIVDRSPSKILVRLEPVSTKNILVEAKVNGNPADGYELGDAQVKPIQVEVRGAETVLDDLDRAVVEINLNGDAASIDDEYKLTAYDANGKQMRFLSFTPEVAQVKVPITKLSGGRVIGIRPKVEGAPSSGYWMSDIKVDPTTIVLVGEAERLKSLDYIETEKIDVSGLTTSREFSVNLRLPKGVEVATSEPKTIKVKVVMSSFLATREVTAGISYTGLADGLSVSSVSPKIIKVMVSGTSYLLNSLNSDNVVANINLSGKREGTYQVSIGRGDVTVPPTAHVSSVVPSAVNVKIK